MSAPVTPVAAEVGPGSSLRQLLGRSARPTLLLNGMTNSPDVADDVRVLDLPQPPATLDRSAFDAGPWASVVVAVEDAAAFRAAAPLIADGLRARAVVVWMASGKPIFCTPKPEWPALVEVDSHSLSTASAVTRLRFANPVLVAEVVGALQRAAGTPTLAPGLVSADGLVLVSSPMTGEVKVPADITVDPAATDLEPSPVTGRTPVLETTRPILDEGVFNPIGFNRGAGADPVPLSALPTPIGPADVARLRASRGVLVDQPTSARTEDLWALAASAVPLADCGGQWPEGLRGGRAEDLNNALAREEISVEQRRVALRQHSATAWRRAVGARASVRTVGAPSVSVLLVTRRSEMLAFALGQVAKQREHGGVEVILGAHGFTPDQHVLATSGLDPVVVQAPETTSFGELLNQALERASGDLVLKMDDDDWYGPEVIADLIDARRWSGAQLVGMPAEFVYLEPINLTLRRRGPIENFGSVVAGGTMMIERDLLRSLGGFRPYTRSVDAGLLDSVRRIGGSTYRTQGLGYLLRRTWQGHTWNPGAGYFLKHGTVVAQWRGFRPSRLLEFAENERPGGER